MNHPLIPSGPRRSAFGAGARGSASADFWPTGTCPAAEPIGPHEAHGDLMGGPWAGGLMGLLHPRQRPHGAAMRGPSVTSIPMSSAMKLHGGWPPPHGPRHGTAMGSMGLRLTCRPRRAQPARHKPPAIGPSRRWGRSRGRRSSASMGGGPWMPARGRGAVRGSQYVRVRACVGPPARSEAAHRHCLANGVAITSDQKRPGAPTELT